MKKLLIMIVSAYSRYISPLFGRKCKYYPSCSQYAVEAVSHYGLLKGMVKSTLRVARCNPFSHGGYDPVK